MFLFLHYFVPSAWITAWTVTLCLWLYCWLFAKHGILHWEILNVFIQVFNGNKTEFFIQPALQYVSSYLRHILLLKGDTVWVFQKHDIQRKCYCSTKYFNAIKLRVKCKKVDCGALSDQEALWKRLCTPDRSNVISISRFCVHLLVS